MSKSEKGFGLTVVVGLVLAIILLNMVAAPGTPLLLDCHVNTGC